MKTIILIADNVISGFMSMVCVYAVYHHANNLIGLSIILGILWIFFLIFKYSIEY
jgi:hypothetical protein